MTEWFSARPLRERVLIVLALGLALVALAWQAILVPVREARSSAAVRYEAAARLHQGVVVAHQKALLEQGQAAAGSGQQPVATDNVRTLVVETANAAGLPLTRIQGNGTDTVSLTFEAADPQMLFGFLIDLQSRFSLIVQRASLTQDPGGTVRAVIEFGDGEG